MVIARVIYYAAILFAAIVAAMKSSGDSWEASIKAAAVVTSIIGVFITLAWLGEVLF